MSERQRANVSAHPRPLELERWSVDDLPAAERAWVASHLEACATCRAFVDGLAGERDERLAAVPPAAFVARLRARRRAWPARARWGAVVGALAAAAALVIVWSRPTKTRYKGTGVTIERQRDGRVAVLGSDERVRAGDGLRVTMTLAEPATVAVWFVDDGGRVDPLLDAPLALGAGQRSLPGSVTVEAPCVDGWLVAATGAAASAEAEVRRRVAAALASATLGEPRHWAPDGAVVQRLRCE